jgi:hypothetical protein
MKRKIYKCNVPHPHDKIETNPKSPFYNQIKRTLGFCYKISDISHLVKMSIDGETIIKEYLTEDMTIFLDNAKELYCDWTVVNNFNNN